MKSYVKNVPDGASRHFYWVVRVVDAEMWFYGAYDEYDRAKEIAVELGNGLVVS